MIFVALGSNLPSPIHGPPLATCQAALEVLTTRGVSIRRRSRWYRSLAVPSADQPPFINGVVEVVTTLPAEALMAMLQEVEGAFGRQRRTPNAARILDLDLLCYHGAVTPPGATVTLPHPRLHLRGFVLKPLADLEPEWRHPISEQDIAALVAALPADQWAEPLTA